MTMDDPGTTLGDELISSLREGLDILDGKVAPARLYPAPAAVDVRAIRAGLKLSQVGFARRFGFSPATVRDWEQGRRRPEAAARILLLVIAHNPGVVDDAIRAGMPRAA